MLTTLPKYVVKFVVWNSNAYNITQIRCQICCKCVGNLQNMIKSGANACSMAKHKN